VIDADLFGGNTELGEESTGPMAKGRLFSHDEVQMQGFLRRPRLFETGSL
jgi:hypothetical protein